MSKEPPVERFRITCEVEPANLGPTVAQLTKLGLANIHFELIEDVRAFAKKTSHEIKAEDFLTAWIADHPTFRAVEAIKAFRADGRTDGAGYSALRTMVENKVLKRLDPGNYARADVKHLAAPKKKDPKAHTNRYEVSHIDFILRAARRAHGRFSSLKIKDLFEKDGRGRDSVSTAISTLVARKLVKRVGEGEYMLVTPTNGAKPNGEAVEQVHG